MRPTAITCPDCERTVQVGKHGVIPARCQPCGRRAKTDRGRPIRQVHMDALATAVTLQRLGINDAITHLEHDEIRRALDVLIRIPSLNDVLNREGTHDRHPHVGP